MVNKRSLEYQRVVTVAGMTLWGLSAIGTLVSYSINDLFNLFTLSLVVCILGLFPQKFRLPLGPSFTREEMAFSISDSVVILVACWYGFYAAVFVGGLESLISSRRSLKRLSINLFSQGMMSLSIAAASVTLSAVMEYVFKAQEPYRNQPFLDVTVAMFVANIVQMSANIIFLSVLLSLRHGDPIKQHMKGFLGAAMMFLPTSSAASLMYLALQYDIWALVIIGMPIIMTIYFWHRHFRESAKKRIAVLEKAHRETIEALAVAINAKDEVTHEHVMRVQIYASGVAKLLGCMDDEVEALKAGALLHDIGKIAVPDYILEKPGKLTAAEFEKMKLHTIAGAQIVGRVDFPYPIAPIIRHHHERWDGKGYPDGLKEEEIPLTARILSVVDCFDAVREDRQYRKGMTRDEAISLILRGSGTQYDPKVVSTFIAHLTEFEKEIESRKDTPTPNFGIIPLEQLSETARLVPPAAGLADEELKNQQQGAPLDDPIRALCEIAQAVITSGSESDLLRAFADKLKLMVPYDTCAITMVLPDTGLSVVTHAAGQNAEALQGRKITLGEGVTGWVIANRKPFCNTDPKLDLPPHLTERFADYRTLAVFPMIKEDLIFGAVTLYSRRAAKYDMEQQKLIGESTRLLASRLLAISTTPQTSTQAQAESSHVISISTGSLIRRKTGETSVKSGLAS
jgi:putative nucleotidyltransferase with HDIG domain